jgi:TetR/AcrR family transcriptional repressor of nem operon
MKQPGDTRDKIVHLADELIRVKGYNAFSYKDIAATLDIKNAAVHYHFQTKEELGAIVVDQEIGLFRQYIQNWSELPPNEQMKRFFEQFRKYSQGGFLCMMGALSADFDTLPSAVKAKVRELSTYLLNWVTLVLEEGRKSGLLRFDGTAYDRSLLIMSDLMSSLILSRVLGADAFTRVSAQLLKDLNA